MVIHPSVEGRLSCEHEPNIRFNKELFFISARAPISSAYCMTIETKNPIISVSISVPLVSHTTVNNNS